MKHGSILHSWFLEEFKGERERIRAVEDLLRAGHTGLAESVAIRSLRGRYKTTEGKSTGIKVSSGGQSYFI